MCEVKLINSSNGSSVVIETSARTFGQLKADIKVKAPEFAGLNWDASKVMLKDSNPVKKALGNDTDTLSGEASYKVYILPAKFDSGAGYTKAQLVDVVEEIEEKFAELRSHLSSFKTKLNASKVETSCKSVSLDSEDRREIENIKRGK